MTGAGFGGCGVAMVNKDKTSEFKKAFQDGYAKITGVQPRLYNCKPSRGVSSLLL